MMVLPIPSCLELVLDWPCHLWWPKSCDGISRKTLGKVSLLLKETSMTIWSLLPLDVAVFVGEEASDNLSQGRRLQLETRVIRGKIESGSQTCWTSRFSHHRCFLLWNIEFPSIFSYFQLTLFLTAEIWLRQVLLFGISLQTILLL